MLSTSLFLWPCPPFSPSNPLSVIGFRHIQFTRVKFIVSMCMNYSLFMNNSYATPNPKRPSHKLQRSNHRYRHKATGPTHSNRPIQQLTLSNHYRPKATKPEQQKATRPQQFTQGEGRLLKLRASIWKVDCTHKRRPRQWGPSLGVRGLKVGRQS